MCTVSWFLTEHGYELFFNRDELRTRQRALPPRAFTSVSGETVLAPVDSDAGGTWIATNAHGLTVALLNRYQDSADPTAADRRRSRGLLVKDLAAASDIDDTVERLRAMDLTIYAPFTLVLISPSRPPSSLFWNGRRLSAAGTATAPLASSGHHPTAVPAARRALWATLPEIDRQTCLDFHRSHVPQKGAESPCMHRPDARSVSLTHVVVDDRRIAMAYADGPPCSAPLISTAEAPLQRPADVNAA